MAGSFRDKNRQKRNRNAAPRRKSVTGPLSIGRLGHHGEGVAERVGNDGRRQKVFVAYTLPGEEVIAEIEGERALPKEITTASADRVEPECPHFGRCGGCALQHASQEFIATWKRDIVVTALANRSIEAEVLPLVDAHGAGRRRVNFHVRRVGGTLKAGFMRIRSHGLEAIEACPVLSQDLAGTPKLATLLVSPLRSKDSAFEVAFTATNNGLDVNITGRGISLGDDELKTRSALSNLAQTHDLARLCVNSEIMAQRRPATVTMGSVSVALPPGAFLQATAKGEDVLADHVVTALDGARRVADLFAGLGPFALRLAAKATVHAVDNNAPGLTALAATAGGMSGGAVSTEMRDLLRRPLQDDELANYDAVVFDPPRGGAELQAKALAKSDIPKVVAVSCDPASFARDAAALLSGGYKMGPVLPVDQFKWSSHVEMVCTFQR